MLICKYTKLSTAAYMPHLDLLRNFDRAIRRKGLQINFSEGFNPHARLFFSQPLALGLKSMCEYFYAESNEDSETFMQKLNESLPQGVQILASASTKLNPNPAALMAIADYEVTLGKPLEKDIDFSQILKEKEIIINYISKGRTVEKDVRNLIFEIQNTRDKFYFKLACGNINLRADRLAEHLLKSAGHTSDIDILKTNVYDKNNINLDKIFFTKDKNI